MTKTKILAVSDIHGDTHAVKQLAKKAKKEKVDLVILAGDLTFFEMDTKNLVGPFMKNDTPVLILHGNHESLATTDFMSEYYGAKNLHGYSFTTNDVGIFGCGGADIGMPPMTEKDFMKTLNNAHQGVKGLKKKIMVTHMHPTNTQMEFSGIEGSKEIRKAIEKFKPDIFLSGHIHEAEGMTERIGKTTLYSIGKKGKIIEI